MDNPLRKVIEEKAPVVLLSHPPTADRVRNLQALWEKLPRKGGFVNLTNDLFFSRHSAPTNR